jgi:hypothetical protein
VVISVGSAGHHGTVASGGPQDTPRGESKTTVQFNGALIRCFASVDSASRLSDRTSEAGAAFVYFKKVKPPVATWCPSFDVSANGCVTLPVRNPSDTIGSMPIRWNTWTLLQAVQFDYEKAPKQRSVRLTTPTAGVGDPVRIGMSGVEIEGRITPSPARKRETDGAARRTDQAGA